MTPISANKRVMLITCLIALANAQYGFDAAVIASFQAMRGFLENFGYPEPSPRSGWGISTTTQQLITSFLNVGTIVGVLFTGPFSRFFGRRQGIWMGTLLGFAGCSVQLGARTVAGLCVGRALMGASNSFFITFANAYVAECVPSHLRSLCSGILGVTIPVGGLLGTVVPYLTKDVPGRLCYQIGLACLFVFPLCLSIVVVFIPESPRWLLVRGSTDDAERALAILRDNSLTVVQFQEELAEMIRGIEEEKALASSASLVDMFKGTDLRRTMLCVGTVTSRAASGIWVFISYGVSSLVLHSPSVSSLFEFRHCVSPTNEIDLFLQTGRHRQPLCHVHVQPFGGHRQLRHCHLLQLLVLRPSVDDSLCDRCRRTVDDRGRARRRHCARQCCSGKELCGLFHHLQRAVRLVFRRRDLAHLRGGGELPPACADAVDCHGG